LERHNELARIDHVRKLDEIKDSLNFHELLEVRIQSHIEKVFKGEELSGRILKKFNIEIRCQVTLDKARVLEKGIPMPDIKV
jgi:hypothetical protein